MRLICIFSYFCELNLVRFLEMLWANKEIEMRRLLWRRPHRPYHDLTLKWRILSAGKASMLYCVSFIRRLFWSKVSSEFGEIRYHIILKDDKDQGPHSFDQCLSFILIKLIKDYPTQHIVALAPSILIYWENFT